MGDLLRQSIKDLAFLKTENEKLHSIIQTLSKKKKQKKMTISTKEFMKVKSDYEK